MEGMLDKKEKNLDLLSQKVDHPLTV